MNVRDNLLLKLAGEEEPRFTARLLFHLIRHGQHFASDLTQAILDSTEIPEDCPRDLNQCSVFVQGQRERLTFRSKLAPLGFHFSHPQDSISIGISTACAEPLSTVYAIPTDMGARYKVSALFVPEWRASAVEHFIKVPRDTHLVLLSLKDLAGIIEHNFGSLAMVETPLMAASYLRRRNEVSHHGDLPDWLFHTLEKTGTLEHWHLLEKLKTCFRDSDRRISYRPRFIGFSFRHGERRGWLGFHNMPLAMPTGRNVGLVLSLPHRIIPGNRKLQPVDISPTFFGGDTQYRHWEIPYELDWTTYEPWVKCLAGLIT